jgi:hypothetical protein
MQKFWIILIALLSACSPLYVPNTRNVPLFQGQGEAQISAYATSAGLDAQGALALTDNIAIMGNYAYGSEKRVNPAFTRKNSYGEVALGFYKASRKARIELFAGYGVGKGTNLSQYYFFADDFGQGDTIITAKMNRIMIQPSIGTNNRKFNIAFTPRISLVDYTEFMAGDKTEKPNEKPHLFIEPALTGKFHIAGNVKGVFQLGLTQGLPSQAFFDYMPLQFAFGLQIDTGNQLGTRVYK